MKPEASPLDEMPAAVQHLHVRSTPVFQARRGACRPDWSSHRCLPKSAVPSASLRWWSAPAGADTAGAARHRGDPGGAAARKDHPAGPHEAVPRG